MHGIPLPHGQSLQLTALSGSLQKLTHNKKAKAVPMFKPAKPVAQKDQYNWAKLSQFDLDKRLPVNQVVTSCRF